MKPGDAWPVPGGTREIAAIEGGIAWIRESAHPGVVYQYPVAELPAMRERDALNAAFRARQLVGMAADEARRRVLESLDGWEDTLAPMKRGRAKKVLLAQVLYRGRPMSRRDVVRLAVSEGAVPDPGSGCLAWSDGRFLTFPALALEYARHLLAVDWRPERVTVENPTP